MRLLEHAQSREDDLQKENVVEFLKENEELQNLRAVLQKKYSIFLGFGGQIFNYSSVQKKTEIYYYLLLCLIFSFNQLRDQLVEIFKSSRILEG